MRFLPTLAAFILTVQGQAQPQFQPQTFSLPNGLRVILLEDHERPLVRARLELPLDHEASQRPGLAPLALRVLGHSDPAAFRSEDFEQLLAGAGIELTPALRSDGLSWNLLARSRDQDLALGLLADRVFRSVVDPSTLEAERLACWRDTERLDASPQAKLRQLLEPDWTLRAPTLDSLTAVTYEDLLAFYARVLRPDRAVLVLHGDLGQEQAKRLVYLSFGTWTVQPQPPVPTPTGPAAATPPWSNGSRWPQPGPACGPWPWPGRPRIWGRRSRPSWRCSCPGIPPCSPRSSTWKARTWWLSWTRSLWVRARSRNLAAGAPPGAQAARLRGNGPAPGAGRLVCGPVL